ncbi:MAG: hypothetical protein KIS66_03410 [Fimbriimonadaceae bacterium]|nr:hypothetical protein [Fimbriimonadaceae bacterium]
MIAIVFACAALVADSITVTLSTATPVGPISPYVYGINALNAVTGDPAHFSIVRIGGNRHTAYNWETNASNAGSDWYFQNDGFLEEADTPGLAMTKTLDPMFATRRGGLVQLSLQDYVSADKNGGGDVRNSPDYLNTRFHRNWRTNSPTGARPTRSDRNVFQGQFVRALHERYLPNVRQGQPLWFCLDNEPGLWAYTHAEVHPDKATYAEMLARSVPMATTVKQIAPEAKIVGPSGFGWFESYNLVNAPDANGRSFTDFYLDGFRTASQSAGTRLLDYLDYHFYSEHRDASNRRVTDGDTDAVASAARVNAPRSLWDETYVENSWITRDMLGNQPLRFIADHRDRIANHYPGTKLALTEWNFGADHHISGAIATADALGCFGRYGVELATHWELNWQDTRFSRAAFRMYRNFDGRGSTFGDVSIDASFPTGERGRLSVWASRFRADPGHYVLVLLNKTEGPLLVQVSGLTWSAAMARAFVLAGDSPEFTPVSGVSPSVTLPAMSATLIDVLG